VSESQYDLINSADLDGLVRLIDDYCETRSWHDLLGLRDACKAAVANGRQVWPASTLAEYRLALLAPAEIAVQVVDEEAGRFTMGPLTEVIAQNRPSALRFRHALTLMKIVHLFLMTPLTAKAPPV